MNNYPPNEGANFKLVKFYALGILKINRAKILCRDSLSCNILTFWMVNDHHVLLCYLEAIFRRTDATVCCGSVGIFKDSSNFQMFHQKAAIG